MTSNWFAIRWSNPEGGGEFTSDYWYTGEGEEQEGMSRQEFVDHCVQAGEEQGFMVIHAPSGACVEEADSPTSGEPESEG